MSLRGGSCSRSCRCPGARQWMQRPSMLCFPPASARGLVAEATVFSEVWLPRAICSTSPEGVALPSEHDRSTLPVLGLTGQEGFGVLEVGKCPVRHAMFVGKEEGKATHDGRRPSMVASLRGRVPARRARSRECSTRSANASTGGRRASGGRPMTAGATQSDRGGIPARRSAHDPRPQAVLTTRGIRRFRRSPCSRSGGPYTSRIRKDPSVHPT